jgi:hypothetical protein
MNLFKCLKKEHENGLLVNLENLSRSLHGRQLLPFIAGLDANY